MTPEGELPQAEIPEVPQVPQPTDAEFRQQRTRDRIDMDVFLGPPYGQRHGDQWSIGGVQPRWPVEKSQKTVSLNLGYLLHPNGDVTIADRTQSIPEGAKWLEEK